VGVAVWQKQPLLQAHVDNSNSNHKKPQEEKNVAIFHCAISNLAVTKTVAKKKSSIKLKR